ncbi:lipopolysaccharide core heptose(I) kinase RfaP [Methylophaga sp.]|uniref:lipopolysaccharide core heptose(I) kinase RfaP n=1 Tax=Methylophaga sp. TaxID=2024840 RepID=UPI003F6A52D2
MKQTVYIRKDLETAWQNQDCFDLLAKQQGDIYRDKEGRRTLRFTLNGHSYFLKYHAGVGWGEIVKNLLQFRLPIISAKNEWQAIQRFHQLGIGTMTLAAYGERGSNPAKRHSFVVTDDLVNTMSLEDLGKQWRYNRPDFQTKQILIEKLATMSRAMHQAGINHRDYYLCHFLLTDTFADTNVIEADTAVFLIDLHRAQQRRKVPRRWLVKDLGSLYFSAHEVELTQRDLYRFMKTYSDKSLRKIVEQDLAFWRKVEQRAQVLFAKWQGQNAS